MNAVAVVIPFFQREGQILSRAIESITKQTVSSDVSVTIIVVDDGSPFPAKQEEFPPLPANMKLRIVEQVNGGVGSARNFGLASVPEKTDCVAFLDSDDAWAPHHLERALDALNGGADFYFDNNLIDEGVDAFSYSRFMGGKYGYVNTGDNSIHWISGAEAFEAILRECLPHTSQVVFKAKRSLGLRFETELKRAGEDQIFWLTLASQAARVAYCLAVMGERGKGVSIYRETLAWDSPNAISRVVDELMMRDIIKSRFTLDYGQRSALEQDQREVFQHYTFLCIRNFLRQSGPVMSSLYRLCRHSPRMWLFLPGALFAMPSYVRRLRLKHV